MGIDGSIDATGRPEVLKTLLNASAKKGKVVTVGVGEVRSSFPCRVSGYFNFILPKINPSWHKPQLYAEVSTCIFDTVNSGRTYVSCCMGNCYPQEFIPMLLQNWKEGKFPFTNLVEMYPAREMKRAAKDVLGGDVIKAVLAWD
jgi:aryl-alcohol dehydrogenase